MPFSSPLTPSYADHVTTEVIDGACVPWVFSSFDKEYAALRQQRGLLDFAALGRISVAGTGAEAFLQQQLARDIGYLFPERSLTSLLLDDEATPIDVVVVHRVSGGYLLETAVGRGSDTLRHLQDAAPDDVELRDLSDEQAVIGLEGPFAWDVLGRVFGPELTGMPYQGVAEARWDDDGVLVSRTGFTGEYGYKLYVATDFAAALWDRLVEEVEPVGYQALEVAMLEVRQPMLHRELSRDGTVTRCGLNWLVELDKDSFVGLDALLAERKRDPDLLTAGFVAEPELELGNDALVVAGGELEIGRVVHTAYSPGLDKLIGLARIEAEWNAQGLELEAEDARGTRQPIRTASAPFLIPLSWTVPVL